MEGRAATDRDLRPERTHGLPAWVLGVVPLLLIVIAVGAFAALDGPGLGERRGPPAEQLAVERTVLEPGAIELTVRNDGPDAVAVAQAQVNDAFVQFSGADQPIGRLESAKVTLQQPWIEGEAYEVALLTSSGGTIAHEIPVAVEGFELAAEGSQAFGGAALVLVGAAVAFLALTGISAWLEQRRRTARAAGASGGQLALLVAVGIGLHNLGEGVAIGSAYSAGAPALGAFLVIGFALHNTTEGLAIVAPVAHLKPSLSRLVLLGLVAGAPAVLGAWIGAAAFNASLAAFLFGFWAASP